MSDDVTIGDRVRHKYFDHGHRFGFVRSWSENPFSGKTEWVNVEWDNGERDQAPVTSLDKRTVLDDLAEIE
jgi:hypothetical protein